MSTAVDTPAKVSRAILEDRYHAALNVAGGDDPSLLQLKLWDGYRKLLRKVTRQRWDEGGPDTYDAEGRYVDVIAEIDAAVREVILRRVDELGIAAGVER